MSWNANESRRRFLKIGASIVLATTAPAAGAAVRFKRKSPASHDLVEVGLLLGTGGHSDGIWGRIINPPEGQIRRTAELGAVMAELHTGAYANARAAAERRQCLAELAAGADLGRQVGLTVNAGHGLTYTNVAAVVRTLKPHELHIGHSIVSRAVFVGLREAVRQMKEIIWKTEALR